MNGKPSIPAIAKLAPPILVITLIYLAIKEIFSAKDTENKPETAPTNTETENPRKEVESLVFRPIPAEIPSKLKLHSAPVPVVVPSNSIPSAFKGFVPPVSRVVIPPVSAAPMAKNPAPGVSSAKITAKIPPKNRQFITEEHLTVIFKNGARSLDRKTAVAALHSLGFGKTAAYEALSPDGRFSACLNCTPDGIISWAN
jgi:hypothetical protein